MTTRWVGACRWAGLIISFIGGRGTRRDQKVDWRIRMGWPYYFIQRRGWKHMVTTRWAGA